MEISTVLEVTYFSLTPHFKASLIEGRLVFFTPGLYTVLEADGLHHLGEKLLRGSHTFDDLKQALAGDLEEADIIDFLDELEQAGWVIRHEKRTLDGKKWLWTRLGVPEKQVAAFLDQFKYSIESDGVEVGWLATAFSDWSLVEHEGGGDYQVVVTHDLFNQQLALINEEMLSQEKSWLLIHQGFSEVDVVFFDGTGAPCWNCLQERIRFNNPEHELEQLSQSTQRERSLHELHALHLIGLQIGEALLRSRLVDSEERSTGYLKRYSIYPPANSLHPIQRRYSCRDCGNHDSPLVSTRLQFEQLANLQDEEPAPIFDYDALVEPYLKFVDPVTGVIRELSKAPSTEAFPQLHVWAAYHSFVSAKMDLEDLHAMRGFHSTGKGETPAEAKALAIFEALERVSGLWRDGIPVRTATMAELGSAAVHPDQLQGFSQQQLDDRDAWMDIAVEHPSLTVPVPFNEKEEVDWVEAWSLTHQAVRYLPAAYAFYNAPTNHPSPFFSHSNGCAAGQSVVDAALRGLFEVLERDAISLWWYNQCLRPALDLEGIQTPQIESIKATCELLGRTFWVLDLTTDLSIPVYVALSKSTDGDPGWAMGFGCDIDPARALNRSLSEMNQLLAAVLLDDKPTKMWTPFPEGMDDAFLYPNGRHALTEKTISAEQPIEKLSAMTQRLAQQGFEVIVLDQTDPNIGLPVVRTVVPNTYHFWRRLGGSRIRQAVVDMGWRRQPLAEYEMNPSSIVI